MPASPSAPESPPRWRFRVALSYPGEHRDVVAKVAEHLATALGEERVLYDKFHEAEFARPELDVYLPELYRKDSELIVVFLCAEYLGKQWCRLEWRHIRQLIAKVESGRIMLASFGVLDEDALAKLGILSGDGRVDLDGRSDSEVAELILERLEDNARGAILSPLPPPAPTPAKPTARAWTADPSHRDLADLFDAVQERCAHLQQRKILGKTYELELAWNDLLDDSREEPLAAEGLLDLLHQRKRLLILGEPGSGKSVQMWRLATDLGAAVKQAPKPPPQIPVYLRLSSWGPSDKDFSTWLREEVKDEYHFAQNVTSKWIASNALLPLLDGLEEVSPDDRPRCVAAINRHLEGGDRLAISCQQAAYEALPEPLNVHDEVILKPLSEARIQTFLQDAGGLDVLREALKKNQRLGELARSPLMLRLMIEIFRNATSTELDQALESATEDRVIDLYVTEMLRPPKSPHPGRPARRERYGPDLTHRCLAWFASKLDDRRKRMAHFEIERLQPAWLAPFGRCAYAILSRCVAGVLMAAIWFPAFQDFAFLPFCGLIPGFMVGVIDPLLWWTAPTDGRVRTRWRVLRGVVAGLAVPVVFLLLSPAGERMKIPPGFILALAALIGCVFGWRPGDLHADIRLFENSRLRWSWKRSRLGAAVGLLSGIALTALALLLTQRVSKGLGGGSLRAVLLVCFFCLVLGLLAGGFIGGLEGLTPKERTRRNQGLRSTARECCLVFARVALLFAIPPMAFMALMALMRFAPPLTPNTLLTCAEVGVAIGLFTALWFGGIDILQHFFLRWMLSATSPFPWRWIRFLDHGVDHGLLYQVQGGYEFRHGMVLEYFVRHPERPSAASGA